MRNAECPYQVSFIVLFLFLGRKDRTRRRTNQREPRWRSIAIEDLPAQLNGGGTLAGLDLGDKTIGVAVSDRGLPSRIRDLSSCAEILSRRRGPAVAPGAMKTWRRGDRPAGQHGRQRRPPRPGLPSLRAQHGRLSDLPFVFWDERLSTVAAERTLIEMDFSRRKRANRKIDSAAAAFILQGVLDRLQGLLAGRAPK